MQKSVLIIDDDHDLCELISIVLRKEGFLVTCATNLAEAGKLLKKHPDIIFLDNNLPDGTGLAYLQMHSVDFNESYVIMISADPSRELKQKATDEGIRIFLNKPFSTARIIEILKDLH